MEFSIMRQYTKETDLIRQDNERGTYKPSCRKNCNHFDGNKIPLCNKKYNHFLNEIQSHTLTASLPPPPAPAALVMMQLCQTSTVQLPSIQTLLGRNVSSRGLVLCFHTCNTLRAHNASFQKWISQKVVVVTLLF